MTSHDLVPSKPRGSGAGWAFFALFLLAIVGACVLLPAFALAIGGILKLAVGIVGALIGVVFGLMGAAIGVIAAIFASVIAVFAVFIGLAAAALPVILVIAVLVGIGILIGRGSCG